MAARLRELGSERLTIVNRSFERSLELARAVGADTAELARLPALLAATDLLVLATSAPEPLVTRADLAERSRHLFLVDLGLSPNADPAVSEHPSVTTLTLSDVVSLALAESERESTQSPHVGELVQAAVEEFKPRVASTV